MKNKSAISLIVLVITIVLVLILTSTITVLTSSAIENARILTFAEDLKKVEEAVTIYFQQYNKFPTIGEEKALSKEEILSKVPEVSKKEFNNELDLNHDNVENDKLGSFYAIDLGKIEVEETLRGIERDEEGNPNPSDLYVVAYPSMNVYYLQGLSAKQTFYFSLSPKMDRVVKITPDMLINDENSNITSMADVTVKREKKTWTNQLNILIEANILPNERLFVSIEEGSRHQIVANTGFHNFYFKDSFSQIIDNVDGSVIDTGINSEEIERFHNQAQQDKKMIITKERDNTVIGEIVVDLSNYDVDLPAKTSDASIKSEVYQNVVTFQVSDETSNIASVKYEYLREYDENADANLYYDEVEVYDAAYLYTRGKEATLQDDGTVQISIPKDVEGIQLRAFDTAGNASDYINENTTIPVYIGIHEKNPTKTSVNLKNVIKTDKKINFATIQISADNQNYTQEQNLNLKDMGNGIYKAPVDCENLVGIEEKIYIKINVNYDNDKTETRIKEISIYEEVEDLGEGTRIEEECSFKTPYVPNGFDYLEGSVDKGYVIKDQKNGNEFVWIPVKEEKDFSRGVIGDNRDLTNYTEKDEELNQNIYDSVAKHGGFYIARYETRYQGDAKLDFSKEDTYLQGDITPVIAKEFPIWNYISLNYAKQIAASMYQDETKSTLITSTAFDTTLNWLIESGQKTVEQVVVDSSSWGNYSNSSMDEIILFMEEATNQVVKTNEKKSKRENETLLIHTSNSDKTKANGIYDLAGNVYEWTTETYFEEGIGRGGRYNSFGYDRPASYRFTSRVNDPSNQDVGFRVMLYW